MKKVNYLLLLMSLIFAFSCEMQNELTGFEDENGNPIGGDPIDGDPIDPPGGGGSGGFDDGFDPSLPTNPGNLSEGCAHPTVMTKISYGGFGKITWTVTDNININVYHKGYDAIYFTIYDDFTSGSIRATGANGLFDHTTIIEACLPPTPCFPDYLAIVQEEYIDGTLSGKDEVYLQVADGGWPDGTTYEWVVTREDGTTQNYEASTEKIRKLSASLDNPIIEVMIMTNYQDCERAFITKFDPSIPQAGDGGSLFQVSYKDLFYGWKYGG